METEISLKKHYLHVIDALKKDNEEITFDKAFKMVIR